MITLRMVGRGMSSCALIAKSMGASASTLVESLRRPARGGSGQAATGPLQQASTGFIAGTRGKLAYFAGHDVRVEVALPDFPPIEQAVAGPSPPKGVYSEWRIAETLKVGEVSAVW